MWLRLLKEWVLEPNCLNWFLRSLLVWVKYHLEFPSNLYLQRGPGSLSSIVHPIPMRATADSDVTITEKRLLSSTSYRAGGARKEVEEPDSGGSLVSVTGKCEHNYHCCRPKQKQVLLNQGVTSANHVMLSFPFVIHWWWCQPEATNLGAMTP